MWETEIRIVLFNDSPEKEVEVENQIDFTIK